MRGHDIIVIGTSAGGVGALQEIIRGLPSDLRASIFVVLHLTPHIPSFLPQVLLRAGTLPVQAVTGPTKFRPGRIYVASPDHHLILNGTTVAVHRGPRENRHRPSVDVLFRSAAQSHGPRVIGVVLTGFLDDGTAGLAAIQRVGGITVVQDPEDAMFPDMPASAVQNVKVDHVVPLSQIAPTLVNLVRKPAGRRAAPRVSKEAEIARAALSKMARAGGAERHPDAQRQPGSRPAG